MHKIPTLKFDITDRKTAFVLTMIILAFVVLTWTQDFLRSDIKNSAFYFSESFLFSAFWWLFAPLLFIQYFAVKHTNKKRLEFQVVVIIAPIILHLFAFPFLVWILSMALYYHTYSFRQTLSYTLSEHVYLLVLLYTIPVLIFQFFSNKIKTVKAFPEVQNEGIPPSQIITTFIVSEGNKRHSITVSEIVYFSANPPYVGIHLENKKILKSKH